MVANFSSLLDDHNKQQKKRHSLKLPAVCGLLFVIFGFLATCTLLKFRNDKTDTVNAGLRYKNYEELFKIYKDCLVRNVSCNFVRPGLSIPKDVNLNAFRIVCYYVVSSNLSRSGDLPPTSVDPYLCTHIIIGFASINNETLQLQLPVDKEVYRTIMNLKKSNPSLKILLSVQDISCRGEFARVVSTVQLRKIFTKNTLSFLIAFGFDGIDLDWEFPSWPDADLIQVKNFTLLLTEFRQLIINSSYKNLIMSVAVAAPALIVSQSYEIQEMAKVVDFVNLMSYDYHMYSQYLPLTGPNAPLYRRNADSGYLLTLNTNWSASNWIALGMPLSKVNVGIPTFGHSFRLVNENNNGWNAPAAGIGRTGTGDGFFSYPEACTFIKNTSTTHIFDDEYDVPYAYNGDEWISYDNTLSVGLKASYVKDNKFGGAMIYSLNCDDFKGVCSSNKFPLTRTISNILSG